MMKKIIALILVLSLSLFCFAACKKDKDDTNDNNVPTEKTYSLAIGVAVAQDANEVAETVAIIVTDADGKIVHCRIDAINLEPEIADGEVVGKTYESKAELGDRYGMFTNNEYYGSMLAEWDDQAKAFESYVVGKTAAQVAAIAVDENGFPTDAELTAGCTMGVSEIIVALNNAFASEHKVSFKTASAITSGVSICANVTSDKGTAEYAADFAGVIMADGKVVAAIIDSTAATAAITGTEVGAIEYKGSKLAQGDEYGMLTNNEYYGSMLAEWYDQAQAYANSAVGKTAAELAGLATEGVAGCTMYVGGYKDALEKAASYVR